MRRVFLWAARNRWLKERLPRLRFMRRAVRRFMPGETLEDALAAALPLAGGRDRHDVHAARREPREPGGGRRGRRPLHRGDRQDRRRRDHRRDLGQADPARPRPRRGGLPRPPRPDRRARGRGRLVPVDRHGGERLRRADDRALRAAPRGPAADGDLPPGVPPPDGGRLRAAAPARPRRSAWSRAPTTRRNRSPTRTGAASMRTTSGSPSGSCSTAAAGRSGSASAPTTSALIEQIAEQVGAAGIGATGSRSRCCTASGPTSSSAWRRAGYRVQALIAYGEHWYPWYMRRLAERPANVWFALRQMLP